MKITKFLKKVRVSPVLAAAVLSASLALATVTGATVISGSCGATAEYSLSDSGVLEITGTGNINSYSVSDVPWTEYASQIKSLKIPSGITGIGVNAFLGLDVSPVSVPKSVISIEAHALGYTYDSGSKEFRRISGFVITGAGGSEAERYADVNGFTFRSEDSAFSGACGDNLTWTLGRDGVLTVSGSGSMMDFKSSGTAPWSKYSSKTDGVVITSVIISSGVTSVGNYAFSGCRQLDSVSLPSGLASIGACAFEDCSSLNSAVIPGTVKNVGEAAFYGCSSLESLTVQNGVASIGNSAFSLTAVRDVTLPSSVTALGEKAFYSCESLTGISMTGVTVIGQKAFADCRNLKTVSTGAALTGIGESAFESCGSLVSIAFGQSLSMIGSRAFYECASLTAVTLPDSLSELGSFAFRDCTGIKSVSLGGGITTVPTGAFEGCSNLSSVTFGGAVSTVEERAFTSCPELRAVTIPVSVRHIADNSIGYYYFEAPESSVSGAYTKYTGFTPEIISYYPSAAEKYAAANNFTFTSLGLVPTDGGMLTDRAEWTFNTSTGILTVSGNGAVPGYLMFEEAPWSVFEGYITSVVYAPGITNVGSASFADCASVTSVTLAGTVTEIGDEAFSGTGITSVSLPKGLKTINDGAFSACTELSNVSLSDTVTSIGQFVFRGPNRLTSLYIPESVGFIGSFSVGYDEENKPVKGFCIKGVRGSIAYNYAEINNIDFKENGYTEISDPESGCSVSVIGSDSSDYRLSFVMKSDTLAPNVFLADGEKGFLYEIILMKGNVTAEIEGTATISFPVPDNVSPLGIRIYGMADNGAFSEIDFTVESGRITFSYGSLGNFVITDADLSKLYLITAYYRFADGSEALAPKTFRATPGAAFEIGYSFIEGYLPDVKNISGKINDSDTEIVFTYHPSAVSSDSAETSDGTDDKPGKKSGAAKTVLLIVEIILVLGIIAAVTVLIILSRRKKNEGSRSGKTIAGAAKANDKFADTIVVPDAPTRELDIQSLFADEPEEDKTASSDLRDSQKTQNRNNNGGRKQ